MRRVFGAAADLKRKALKALRLMSVARYRRGLSAGAAAGIEHRDALSGLPVGVAVDVGANKGQFALLALELFPAAVVYAFEPLPAAFARMAAWGRRESRLVMRRSALSDASGDEVIYVAARCDNSSLQKATPLQTELCPAARIVGREIVAVQRLDQVFDAERLGPAALLKIDVQGGELKVLRGAGNLIRRFKWIYVECSFSALYEGQALADEVETFLENVGFRPFSYWNIWRDGQRKPVQVDVLFINQNDDHA